MADSYIDPFEAVTYGELFVNEMRARVMPLNKAWRGAIEHAIALQTEKNERMAALTARVKRPAMDGEKLAEMRDTIVRFGSWLGSLKGRPLDPARFFGGTVPSVVANRRITKVAGQLKQMVDALAPHAKGKDAVQGAAGWLEELRGALSIAVEQRDALRAGQIAQTQLGPEIERARLEWLSTYTANKRLVEGILRHEGAESLMPLIFDDLAEVQRSTAEDGAAGDGAANVSGADGSNEALEPLTSGNDGSEDGPASA